MVCGKVDGVRHFKCGLFVGFHILLVELDCAIDSVFEARDAIGSEGNLMIDCVLRNGTVEWVVLFVECLCFVNLYFMEELLSLDNVFGYVELVQRIGGGGVRWTKIVCGEHEYIEYGFDVFVCFNSVEVL